MSETEPQRSPGSSPAARVAVVVLVAAIAFGGAFLLFGGGSDDMASDTSDGGGGTCEASDAVDAAGSPYQVMVKTDPDPPVPQGTTFRIQVEREGQPVTGATVCMTADMLEMEMDAVGGRAQEVGPGRFELPVEFSMRGAWTGSVVVSETGQEPVSVPVSFDVQ